MATPLKELGQSLRELDKCMAPIHSRSPGDESASRQMRFDATPPQSTEVAPSANAPLLLAAAVPCLRNGQEARVAELAAGGWEAEALEQIGRARALVRRAAGWEAEATATAAASATQSATEPVPAVTATVAERGVDVATTAAVAIGIGSPQPPGGSRRAAGERARAAGERARAAAEEARSVRALADEAALSAAGWAAAAELAEARAAEAAVEEAEAAAEEEAAAAAEADAEARAAAEIAHAVALAAAAGRSPRPAADPDEGSGRYGDTPDGGDRYAGDDTTLWEAPWSRSRGAAAAGTSAGVAAIEAEAQAAAAAAAAALEASNQQLVVAELQMQVRRQEETLGRLRADEARRAASFGATPPHHSNNNSSSNNDLPADAQPLSPTRRAMAAVQGAGAALARSTSKLLADFGSTPTSPSRTAAAAADAASFNPTPGEGWVHNAGPEGGYVRSPVTACGRGGFGGDGGGAEEAGIAAGAVLSAEHGHFALAALSAEAPSTEPRIDRPLLGHRPQANGRASQSPTPSHRAVSAVDGSVHAAVAGGSVEAWLSKASEMQISRRRSFGADGEPLPA